MAHMYREIDYHHHHVLSNMIASIVAIAGGLLTLLLAVRFILSAADVDRLAPFASFVYSSSAPFVAPFLIMFQKQIGVVGFEYQTLIALAFWAVVTWIITSLITYADEED